jgi:CHAT domain-containing protein
MLAQPQAMVKPGFDVFWMTIVRAGPQGRQLRVQCERRGARAIDGPLGPGGVPAAAIQELRRTYEQQVQVMRELAVAGMPAPPPDEGPLLELGRRVAALLPAAVRQAIVAAVRYAQQRRRSLRLILEIADDAPEILRIPWELMALPLGWDARGDGEGSFLLLSADVTLVRRLRGVGLHMPLELSRPLRLQAFAAAPRDVQPIDVGATIETIRQARQSSDMRQHWYDGRGTLNALQERLREASPQVVHLLCHAEQCDIGQSLPRYDLLLTHADGYTHRVSATDLARVLTLAHDLQLVLLQACHAGAVAVGDGERGQATASVALALIRAGVPLVIAMQGEVAQPTADAFVRACYATLARGGCLGRAVAAGRIAMRAAGGVVDWSLPVVYQGSNLVGRTAWLARLAGRFEDLFIRG